MGSQASHGMPEVKSQLGGTLGQEFRGIGVDHLQSCSLSGGTGEGALGRNVHTVGKKYTYHGTSWAT